MGNLDPWRKSIPAVRLGELALEHRLLSEAQLKHALGQQEEDAKKGRLPRQLGIILLSLGFLAEVDLIRLLAEQEKQRTLKEKIEASPPPMRPKDVAGRNDPPRVLKKLPPLVARPKDMPGRL